MSEQDTAQLDATNPNEDVELEDDLQDTEDVEALKAQVAQKDAFARQALARAKKAEAELKAAKAQPAQPTQNTTNNTLTADDVEVKILKAQGLKDDEIAMMKKIAALNGTTIIEAQSDELYQSFKAKKDSEEKADKARLGASKGSSSQKKEKSISSPHLSDEDHKELWRQQNGK